MLNRDKSKDTETNRCLRPPLGVRKLRIVLVQEKVLKICLDNKQDMGKVSRQFVTYGRRTRLMPL